jgi:Recombinase
MVDSVVVAKRTAETITAIVAWSDGSEPTIVEAHLAQYVHRLIRELGDEGIGNSEIARGVNEMDFVTSRGKPWTRETVWSVRFKLGRSKKSSQTERS